MYVIGKLLNEFSYQGQYFGLRIVLCDFKDFQMNHIYYQIKWIYIMLKENIWTAQSFAIKKLLIV